MPTPKLICAVAPKVFLGWCWSMGLWCLICLGGCRQPAGEQVYCVAQGSTGDLIVLRLASHGEAEPVLVSNPFFSTEWVVDAAGRLYFADDGDLARLEPDGGRAIVASGVGDLRGLTSGEDGSYYAFQTSGGFDYLAHIRPSGEVTKTVVSDRVQDRDWGGDLVVARNPVGNFYVPRAGQIMQISPDGTMRSFARIGYDIFAIAIDAQGCLYVLAEDEQGRALHRVSPAGLVEKLFASSSLPRAADMAVDGAGNLLLVDAGDFGEGHVFKVSLTGEIATLIGGLYGPQRILVVPRPSSPALVVWSPTALAASGAFLGITLLLGLVAWRRARRQAKAGRFDGAG